MNCCLNSTSVAVSTTAFTITNILVLLPLYVLILYVGVQRWRQRPSRMTASHFDVFTYHVTFTELISVVGYILWCPQ